MSINSNMKSYVLKKDIPNYDALNTPIDNYVNVDVVTACVNYNTSTKIDNGIVYKITTPSGITDYKSFDLKERYRLEGNGHIFDIEGINQEGRKTLLMLKEVFI